MNVYAVFVDFLLRRERIFIRHSSQNTGTIASGKKNNAVAALAFGHVEGIVGDAD